MGQFAQNFKITNNEIFKQQVFYFTIKTKQNLSTLI